MSDDEKVEDLMNAVERYAAARERAAGERASIREMVGQLVRKGVPVPAAMFHEVEVVEKPRLQLRGNRKPHRKQGDTSAVEPRPPTNMEKVLGAFRDAGMGVELETEEAQKRSGVGSNVIFAYLSKLSRDGLINRVRPGVYTLTEKGKA